MKKQIAGALELAGVTQQDVVMVAVSGGADSMALLHALHSLGQCVCAGHVEHGLRGEASLEDMRFAEDWCRERKIPCFVRRVDVRSLRQKGDSLEAAAREARYGALREMMREAGAQWLAVAHHQDDQAETLLLHLLRGGGYGALAGMRMQTGDVLRPLLLTPKAEIEAYCRENGVAYRTDSTNADEAFVRNRIRHGLIPYIQQKFNPSFTSAASRLCTLAAMDEDFLAAATDEAYARCVEGREDAELHIGLQPLMALAPALQYRVLHRALSQCVGAARVTYTHVHDASALLQMHAGASVDIPGARVWREYDAICVCPQAQDERAQSGQDTQGYRLIIGGETRTPYGVFHTTLQRERTVEPGPWAQYFDADTFPEDACVRTRRPGDWMQPLGMDGRQKLQDVMVDARIPRRKRDAWPLVAAQSVLWVVGAKRSQEARLTEATKRLLLITFTQNGGI